MRFSVIVAARTGSSRLPGKALLPLGGIPMIRFLMRRLRNTKLATDLVLATTDLTEDDPLSREVAADGVPVFRGAGEDVVNRFDTAARELDAEYVVRVTGDCPFIDSETLDYCLSACRSFGEFDLATTRSAFPVGIDFEIYRADVLRRLHESGVLSPSDREHVTKYFYDHESEFDIRLIEPRPEWFQGSRRFTVDTPEDYDFARKLVESFDGIDFTVGDLLRHAEGVQ